MPAAYLQYRIQQPNSFADICSFNPGPPILPTDHSHCCHGAMHGARCILHGSCSPVDIRRIPEYAYKHHGQQQIHQHKARQVPIVHQTERPSTHSPTDLPSTTAVLKVKRLAINARSETPRMEETLVEEDLQKEDLQLSNGTHVSSCARAVAFFVSVQFTVLKYCTFLISWQGSLSPLLWIHLLGYFSLGFSPPCNRVSLHVQCKGCRGHHVRKPL